MSANGDRGLGATEYAELIGRVRETVAATVPPGSSLLVVSRGDEALLDQPGIRAEHFPQAEDGGYAGYHPLDGAAAREQLEARRRAGAEYLAIPATARWWLEFYEELAQHLSLHGELLADVPETCMVYGLGSHREATAVLPVAEPPEAGPEQIRDFLERLLHSSSRFFVLEPDPGFAAALEPLRAIAMPIPPRPTPAEFRTELGRRVGAGAGYLVVPRSCDRRLRGHGFPEEELEGELRKVADQPHLCRVFEINRGKRGK